MSQDKGYALSHVAEKVAEQVVAYLANNHGMGFPLTVISLSEARSAAQMALADLQRFQTPHAASVEVRASRRFQDTFEGYGVGSGNLLPVIELVLSSGSGTRSASVLLDGGCFGLPTTVVLERPEDAFHRIMTGAMGTQVTKPSLDRIRCQFSDEDLTLLRFKVENSRLAVRVATTDGRKLECTIPVAEIVEVKATDDGEAA